MGGTRERGTTLVVVMFVMLILSAVGMTLVYMSESENLTAGTGTHFHEALYVAEAGLRHGEDLLNEYSSSDAAGLLAHTSVAVTPAVYPNMPAFPQDQNEYDAIHLGTYLTDPNGLELANVEAGLAVVTGGAPMPTGYYSLYVRNNVMDPSIYDNDDSTGGNVDSDLTLNLVSVGWVELSGEILAVKILEEEFTWVSMNQDPTAQKLLDSGGTSSGVFGG